MLRSVFLLYYFEVMFITIYLSLFVTFIIWLKSSVCCRWSRWARLLWWSIWVVKSTTRSYCHDSHSSGQRRRHQGWRQTVRVNMLQRNELIHTALRHVTRYILFQHLQMNWFSAKKNKTRNDIMVICYPYILYVLFIANPLRGHHDDDP